MELLLILSAMLSAFTGAFTGVRGPEASQAQTEAASGVVVEIAEETVARAETALPRNDQPAIEPPALPTFTLAAAIPLYADRLIE